MWTALSSLLAQLITSLISQFAYTKKEYITKIDKVTYSKVSLTPINTFSAQDLIKKYDTNKVV